jgi:hypothetical protein
LNDNYQDDKSTEAPGGASSEPAQPSPEPAAVPTGPAIGTGAALVGVLASPKETFGRLAERPSWSALVPFLILLIMSVAGSWLYMSKADMKEVIRQEIIHGRAASQLSPAQIDEIAEKAAARPAWVYLAINVVGTTVKYLFLALVFWLVLMAFGETVSYPGTLKAVWWAQIPLILFLAIFMVVIFFKDPTNLDPKNPLMTNLGYLFGRDSLGKPLYALLSDLDIVAIWVLWLETLGIAAFAKAKVAKVGGVVFGLYGLYMLGHAGLAAIF